MTDRVPSWRPAPPPATGSPPRPLCGVVMSCGRPLLHRGHHGGFQRVSDPRPGALTPAELRVVRVMAGGASWDEATHRLGISRSTLVHHRTSALRKYGVGTFVELLAALGWLTLPPAAAA